MRSNSKPNKKGMKQMEYTREILVTNQELIEAFKIYLKRELGYNDDEAKIAATDMENPYMTPFIVQEYEEEIELDGIVYEVRSCRTDFSMCGLYYLADLTPFEFDMLIDMTNVEEELVSEYKAADKLFYLKGN